MDNELIVHYPLFILHYLLIYFLNFPLLFFFFGKDKLHRFAHFAGEQSNTQYLIHCINVVKFQVFDVGLVYLFNILPVL